MLTAVISDLAWYKNNIWTLKTSDFCCQWRRWRKSCHCLNKRMTWIEYETWADYSFKQEHGSLPPVSIQLFSSTVFKDVSQESHFLFRYTTKSICLPLDLRWSCDLLWQMKCRSSDILGWLWSSLWGEAIHLATQKKIMTQRGRYPSVAKYTDS